MIAREVLTTRHAPAFMNPVILNTVILNLVILTKKVGARPPSE